MNNVAVMKKYKYSAKSGANTTIDRGEVDFSNSKLQFVLLASY